MKKGKEKNSKKTPENKMDEQNNNLYNTKQTVTFDGFLVYEKVTEEEENFFQHYCLIPASSTLTSWRILG